jgi:hypothetical protein
MEYSRVRLARLLLRARQEDNDMGFFQNNEHTIDRIIRVALGVALLALAFVGPKTAWGYLGVAPLVTGLVGTCPIYSLLGIRTNRVASTGGESGR